MIRASLCGLLLCSALALTAEARAEQPAPPADQYAPLNTEEWSQMVAGYRQLADCEDSYMTKAGVNGAELGRRLAAQGKAAEIRAQTLKLLDPQSPWRKSLTAADAKDADVTTQALMALMMDGNQDGRTRIETMTRVGYVRYYTALATDGTCVPFQHFIDLLHKSAP